MSNGEDFQQARQMSPGFDGAAPSPNTDPEDDNQRAEDSGAESITPTPARNAQSDQQVDSDSDSKPRIEPTEYKNNGQDGEDFQQARQTSPASDGTAPSQDTATGDDQQGAKGSGAESITPTPSRNAQSDQQVDSGSKPRIEPTEYENIGQKGDDFQQARQTSPAIDGTAPSPDTAIGDDQQGAKGSGAESITPTPARNAQSDQQIASGPGPRVETTEYENIDLTTPRERLAQRISERTGADVGPGDIRTQLVGPSGTPAAKLTPQQERSIAESGSTITPTVTLSPEARQAIERARARRGSQETGPRLLASQGVDLGTGGLPSARERKRLVTKAATRGGLLSEGQEQTLEGLAKGYSQTFRRFFESDPVVKGKSNPPQDVFLESAAQSAVEIGNLPGIVLSGERAADVATGAPTLLTFSGTTAQFAGKTAAKAIGQGVQFAQENPLRASGALAGIGVTAGASAAGASETGARGIVQAARAVRKGDVDIPSRGQLVRRAGAELRAELDPRVTPFGDFRGRASQIARLLADRDGRASQIARLLTDRDGRAGQLARQFAGEERGQAQLIPRGVRKERPEIGGEGADIEIDEPTISPERDPRGPPPGVQDPAERARRLGQQTNIPPGARRRQQQAIISSIADDDTDVMQLSFTPSFRAAEAAGVGGLQLFSRAQTAPRKRVEQAERIDTLDNLLLPTDLDRQRPKRDTLARTDANTDALLDTNVDVDQDVETLTDVDTVMNREREPRDPNRDLARTDLDTDDQRERDRNREIESETDRQRKSRLFGRLSDTYRYKGEDLLNSLGG